MDRRSGSRPEFRPLDAPFGAEALGADPARPLEDSTLRALREALRRHRLLLFRGEPRSAQALVGFARCFGSLITLYDHETTVLGHPEIVRVSNIEVDGRPIGLAGVQELPWHHDHSYLACPAKESFLEATELPARPPHTCFVDMASAFDELPATLRERIQGLSVVHHIDERAGEEMGAAPMGVSGTTPIYDDPTNVLAQDRIASQRAVHPLVVRHPESGTRSLYASPLATHEIPGLEREEGRELLASLFELAFRPERIYTHAWSRGDLVVWDTISLLHRREAFEPSGRRLMRQLSTRTERPLEAA